MPTHFTRNAEDAFRNALDRNALSLDSQAENCVMGYMYMYSSTICDVVVHERNVHADQRLDVNELSRYATGTCRYDHFKHSDTRKYIRVAY